MTKHEKVPNGQRAFERKGRPAKRDPQRRPLGPPLYVAFAERLERLRQSTGEPKTRFAKRCGVTPASRMGEYLRGEKQPGFDLLHRIAEATGVSLDWLLFGDGGEEPRRRGETQTQADFHDEFAARVLRGVREELAHSPSTPAEQYSSWACFADGVLDRVVTEQVRVFSAFRAWQLRVAAVRAALQPLELSSREILGAFSAPPDDPRHAQPGKLRTAEERLATALQAFDPPPVPFVWPHRIQRQPSNAAAPPATRADARRGAPRFDEVEGSGRPAWLRARYVASGRMVGRRETPAENAAFDQAPDPTRARRIESRSPV
jgi:transcriptional regulator with XRE-family HTH domain